VGTKLTKETVRFVDSCHIPAVRRSTIDREDERKISCYPPVLISPQSMEKCSIIYKLHLSRLATSTDSIGTSYSYTFPNVASDKLANQPNAATIQKVRYVDISINKLGRETSSKLLDPTPVTKNTHVISFLTGPSMRISDKTQYL